MPSLYTFPRDDELSVAAVPGKVLHRPGIALKSSTENFRVHGAFSSKFVRSWALSSVTPLTVPRGDFPCERSFVPLLPR